MTMAWEQRFSHPKFNINKKNNCKSCYFSKTLLYILEGQVKQSLAASAVGFSCYLVKLSAFGLVESAVC